MFVPRAKDTPPPESLFASRAESDDVVSTIERLYREASLEEKIIMSDAMDSMRADKNSEGLSKVGYTKRNCEKVQFNSLAH